MSTYDFSTFYTTLPHNLIIEKLTELIKYIFNREGPFCLACGEKRACFTFETHKRYDLWSCQKVFDALHYLLDNILIIFVSKLYTLVVGFQMDTNCVPHAANLFSFVMRRLHVVYFCQILN